MRPSIHGPQRRVGATLRARPGRWNLAGLTYRYQWLRDGRAIPRATTTRYVLRPADLRSRIGIRVTASRAGHHDGVAHARPTRVILPARSTVRATARPTPARPGRPVRINVRLRATGAAKATGRVQVRRAGRVIGTGRVVRGRATVTVRLRQRGVHRLRVIYRGPRAFANGRAMTRVVVR